MSATEVLAQLPVKINVPSTFDIMTPENTVLGSAMGYIQKDVLNAPANTGGDAGNNGETVFDTSLGSIFWGSAPELESIIDVVATNADASGFTGVANLEDSFGVKAFAQNNVIKTCTVQMGAKQFTTKISPYLIPLTYNMDAETLSYVSPVSRLDTHDTFVKTIMDNPLRTGLNTLHGVQSRGAGCNYQIVSSSWNSSTKAITVRVKIKTRLMAQPFQWARRNPPPMPGIPNIRVQIDWDSDISRMFNFGSEAMYLGSTHTTVTATAVSHKLLFEQYNPLSSFTMPRVSLYEAPNVTQLLSQKVTMTSGTSETLPNLNVTFVPKMFAMYLEPVYTSDYEYYGPTRFGGFSSVEMAINGNDGLFRNHTLEQLYDVSKANGYYGRFATFAKALSDPLSSTTTKGCGGIFYFAPKDFSANADMSAGSKVVFPLTLTVVPSESGTFNVKIFAIHDNLIASSNGVFTDVQTYVDTNKIVRAEMAMEGDSVHFLGGSFWDWLKKAGKTALKVIKSPVGKAISKVARNLPVIKDVVGDNTAVGQIVKSTGYGVHGGQAVNIQDLLNQPDY